MSSRPERGDDERRPNGDLPPLDGDGDAGGASTAPAGDERPRTPITQQIGRIVVLVVLGVFLVFALSNSQPVDFSWVFGGTEVTRDPASGDRSGGVPLIVLLLIAFVIGAVVGVAGARARRRRRSRQAHEEGTA